MTLAGAIEVIADGIRSVEGISTSTAEPPEQMAVDDFPAVAVYLGKGNARHYTADNGNGYPTFLMTNTIVVDLHYDRREDEIGVTLFKASRMIMPVLIKIFKMYITRFENNVTAMGDPSMASKYPIAFEFSHLNWGSIETLGYRIRIDVSTEEEVK